MSSLFQGFTDEKGIITMRNTTSPTAGSFIYRGIRVEADGTVLRRAWAAVPYTHVGGIAVDTEGIILGNGTALPRIITSGGVLVDQNGSPWLSGAVPDVIHQGVGLTTEGRLCIVTAA